jgi:hypothetical protein
VGRTPEPAPAQAAPRREIAIRELPGAESFNRKIETLFGKTRAGKIRWRISGRTCGSARRHDLGCRESAGDTGKKLKELEDFERNGSWETSSWPIFI